MSKSRGNVVGKSKQDSRTWFSKLTPPNHFRNPYTATNDLLFSVMS